MHIMYTYHAQGCRKSNFLRLVGRFVGKSQVTESFASHLYILFVFRSDRGSCVPRPKCPTSLSHDSDPKARVCHPDGRQ